MKGNVISRRGKFFGRLSLPSGRQSFVLACSTIDEARARVAQMSEAASLLEGKGLADHIEGLVRRLASAPLERLPIVQQLVQAVAAGSMAPPAGASPPPTTFAAFAQTWTSGALHAQHPDRVLKKATSKGDLGRLELHVFPHLGAKPLREITLPDCEEVMRRLPPSLSPQSRRHVAQLMSRVLSLAVYPGRLLDHSPLPRGFLPRILGAKAFSYLYPDEDAKLVSASSIPLARRMLYAFLAREGMRASEALSLAWSDLDLAKGAVVIDTNKTKDPRAWALEPQVAEAMRLWRRLHPSGVFVFGNAEGGRLRVDWMAKQLRLDLKSVGVTRTVLFERSSARRPIRIHDLRATFVTLSLAAGKSETWVSDRTGHRSSQMINRYRRAARTAAELGIGELRGMVEAIPELRAMRPSLIGAGSTVEVASSPPSREGEIEANPSAEGALTDGLVVRPKSGDSSRCAPDQSRSAPITSPQIASNLVAGASKLPIGDLADLKASIEHLRAASKDLARDPATARAHLAAALEFYDAAVLADEGATP